MFGLDSIWHWVLVLAIVLVFFGTGKLRNAGSDLGAAIRDFKKGMRGDAETAPAAQLKADMPADASAQVNNTEHERVS